MIMMKGKGGRYRISPNEEDRLLKEETEKRRKLRLIQVREQAKQNAKNIREDVKKEKEKQLLKLARLIENDLEREKMEKIRQLEDQYEYTLKNIGQGHKDAQEHNDGSFERLKKKLEAQENASKRHMRALERLKNEKLLKEVKENKTIMSRKAALEVEKYRAAEIASLPPPPKDPIDEIVDGGKPVLMTDLNAFSTTHYHMPQVAVVKSNELEQKNTKLNAEDEDFRIQENIKERERLLTEQAATAKIRGNQALQKEHLKHEYDALVEDLSLLQRADRKRRQDIVANLPKQVFIPPARRVVEKDQKQRNMEKEFENLYMAGEGCKEDLLMNIAPVPAPDSPVSCDVLDLSAHNSPVKVLPAPGVSQQSHDVSNTLYSQQESVQTDKKESILKKLMNRIKEQRDSHTSRSKLEISHLDVPLSPGKEKIKKDKRLVQLKEYDVEQYQQMWEEVTSLSEYSMPNKTREERDVNDGQTWHQMDEASTSPSIMSPTSHISPKKHSHPPQKGQHQSPTSVDKQAESQNLNNELQFQELLERIQKIEEQKLMLEEKIKLQEEEKHLREVQAKMHAEKLLSLHQAHTAQSVPVQQQAFPDPMSIPPTFNNQIPAQPYQTVRPNMYQTLQTSKLPATNYPGYSFEPAPQSYPAMHQPIGSVYQNQQGPYVAPIHPLSQSMRPVSSNVAYMSDSASMTGGIRQAPSVNPVQQNQFHPHSNVNLQSYTSAFTKPYTASTSYPMNVNNLSQHMVRPPVFPNYHDSTNSAPLAQPHANYSLPSSINNNIANHPIDQLAKVREYQSRLLETHEKRKQLLAKSREDLKKRRDELNEKVVHDQPPPPPPPEVISRKDKPVAGNKLESIRKSLPFDGEDSIAGTPAAAREEDLESEVGDMFTSCSERGSPNLDNTSRSVLSSNPGSSSLIALAEERQKFCEQRQGELKKQLEEIQKQKDSILEKYKQGQEKIHEQRQNSKPKLVNRNDKNQTEYPSSHSETAPDLNLQSVSKEKQVVEELELANKSQISIASDHSAGNMSLEEGELSGDGQRSKRLTWAELLRAEAEREVESIRPPVTRGLFLVDNHDHHQLSTIEEVATPMSERKQVANLDIPPGSGTLSNLPQAKRALEFSSKTHGSGNKLSNPDHSQISGIGGRLSDQPSSIATPVSRIESLESGDIGFNSTSRSSSLTKVTEPSLDNETHAMSEGPLSLLSEQNRVSSDIFGSLPKDYESTRESLGLQTMATPALSKFGEQISAFSSHSKDVESILHEAKQYNEELMSRIREHTKQVFEFPNSTSSITMSLEELSLREQSDSTPTLEEFSMPMLN